MRYMQFGAKTNSDHNIVTCHLNTSTLIRNQKIALVRRKGELRRSFRYDKITTENWDNYKKVILEMLNRDKNKKKDNSISSRIERALSNKGTSRAQLDAIWIDILHVFNKTIDKTIPYENKRANSIMEEKIKKIEKRKYKWRPQLTRPKEI